MSIPRQFRDTKIRKSRPNMEITLDMVKAGYLPTLEEYGKMKLPKYMSYGQIQCMAYNAKRPKTKSKKN